MAVIQLEHKTYKYIGLAADTKPTEAKEGAIPGSTFFEHDTGVLYVTYDGTNWVVKYQ